MAQQRKPKVANVSARLESKELEKLEHVLDLMESLTGERNTSVALRYIVAHFDIASSPLGKAPSLARATA